ncbi:MAG TPA: hypothetical protein VHV10_17865 [Ktedonobacteraceae bacterium]|jgi:hypothetical protein|nr:hypothetical protein [Ktedonobacteraceae bacterium]
MAKAEWISANEAAAIASKNNGRPVIAQYIRDLAARHKIQYKPLDGRTNVYLRSDVEKIRLRSNKKPGRAKETTQLPLPLAEKVIEPPVPASMSEDTSAKKKAS